MGTEVLPASVVHFAQLDALALIRQARVGRVEHGAAVLERGRGRGKIICAAQNGLNLRQQHVQVKGLGDEIVAAHVHGHDDVHIVRRRGQEDDGHAAGAADLPLLPRGT